MKEFTSEVSSYVNQEKQIVVTRVILTHKEYPLQVEATGIAKCSSGDEFNEEFGIKLSKTRALRTAFKLMRNEVISTLQSTADLANNLIAIWGKLDVRVFDAEVKVGTLIDSLSNKDSADDSLR